MRLFRPSRKFTEMPTPEERYQAEQAQAQVQAQAHQPSHAYQETQRRLSERYAEEREATKKRRAQVVSAGTMRRRGRDIVLEGDWKLATGSLPTGEIPRVTRGKVGDLTIKDLHAVAANHGPNCRCGLGR
jgi:hypothetical protein